MKRLKIVSYNIHKSVGLDGRREPARILAVLNEIGADIVVLQEADRRLGARKSTIPRFLIEQETDYRAVDLAQSDVSLGWHGNAVLVRKVIEIGPTSRLHLPGGEPRGAVAVRIGGVRLVGTHLGLLRRSRRLQMRRICEFLGDGLSSAIIAGDFNEWAAVTGYEPFARHLSVITPGPSYPSLRPVGALDGFAFGEALTLVDVGVVRSELTRLASDHLPVAAVFEHQG